MGYLHWKPAPRLWERQDSHVERPMQTAARSPADSQPQLPCNGSEPSRAFRLPASKLLQIMPTGADVSYPLPQMQIQEQTKCWGGLLSVLQLHTAYRDLNSPTRNRTHAPCSWKHELHQGIPQSCGCLSHECWHICCAASIQKYFLTLYLKNVRLPEWLSGKESVCQCRRHRFDPWIENGSSLQYSCLENPMDRRAWWATVDGVAKSWTWLSV